MSDAEGQKAIEQFVSESASALGLQVLGRALTPEEAGAMKAIFRAASQALADGFIQRLADHVLAERREEAIEEFFESKVKAD
jgi:hypothetical protein